MDINKIRQKLIDKGLKVTPQRIAILESVLKLNNHPTADQILEYIRKNNPNISTATVYKVLDALVDSGLIETVKTDRDIKRYDAITTSHHHIYFHDSEDIQDYEDEELNELLKRYFERKEIPGIQIEDIKLQIIGRSTKTKRQINR
jgi:Fur family transcriptional regulator, peroxide stress response regulator